MKPTFSIPNIRLFIAFKVFFNSRFYYPVFTILFLDFGLTIAQFAILNAVWAATIVFAEIPSGALADIAGRKKLLVFATFTMMVEIGIISFVPTKDPFIVFVAFLVNRVLSGLAEAAASGADEAIAYDSLKAEGDSEQWGRVLEILMRFQSIGFIIAMSLGAAIYDPHLLNRLCNMLGFAVSFTQKTTMRFPLYLTFLLAVCAFITTLRMKDPDLNPLEVKTDLNPSIPEKGTTPIRQAFGMTMKAGRWIFNTPFALSVILFGMLFDSIIRMVVTLSSQYYRMIQLPEASFGIIGSLVAVSGLIIPRLARKIAENKSPSYAVYTTAGLSMTGLTFMSFFYPYFGLIPALITFGTMYFTGFFVSFYINRITSSEQRATVLSFKSFAYNISYGLLGIVYALVLKIKRQGLHSQHLEDTVFMNTFPWFPVLFATGFVVLSIIYLIWLKENHAKKIRS